MKSVLYEANTCGYNGYRIPTVICLPSGRIIVFCEGRINSLSDTGHIRILARISDDGGLSFGDPFIVAEDGLNTVGNPTCVYDTATNRLFLLLNGNLSEGGEDKILQGRAPRRVLVCHSDDQGLTWSPLDDITQSVIRKGWTWHATGPCHAIVHQSGRIIIPCNHAELDPRTGESGPYISGCILSDDHGESWYPGGDVGDYTNECSVAELKDGIVYINMRSYAGKGRRAVSRSLDAGLTWSQIVLDEALIEPVCQGSVISQPGTDTLYFTNPASLDRKNLVLKESTDGGTTWGREHVLHAGPAAYSDIAVLPNGRLFIVYECGEENPYERIEFAILDQNDL